jgi:hypothetical protein
LLVGDDLEGPLAAASCNLTHFIADVLDDGVEELTVQSSCPSCTFITSVENSTPEMTSFLRQ